MAAVLLLTSGGCNARHTQAVASQTTPDTKSAIVAKETTTSQPTAAVQAAQPVKVYQNDSAGIRLGYPASWVPEKATTAVFAVAAPAGTPAGYSSLSLDIPKLPWHIPNMIPMSIVAHDYVSDLQKNQIPDAKEQEDVTITVPAASARRITCAGHEKGKTSIDVAVIMIHADQVYILSADSDDAGRDVARKTLDAAVASLKWTK